VTADTILDEAFTALLALSVSVVAACTLTGRSRATHYRRLSPPAGKAAPTPQAERAKPASTLSEQERLRVLEVINQPAYQDLSICQIWARELDEDRYHCSMSSMYRIARQAGQSRERRRLATHPAKKKPELLATGPSQVWSWDITKLRGPHKGLWFHLYALIDIYSRYSPGWMVRAAEDSVVAAQFIDDAIGRNGSAPHDPRGPGHVDDLEDRRDAAGRSWDHPDTLQASGLERQPVLRGPVQDAQVRSRLP